MEVPVALNDLEDYPANERRGFGSQAILLGELVMCRAERALAPLGLTPREYDAMSCICENEGMSQLGLSRRLGLYAPQMVGLIDGLERRGLVKRQVSATDRRKHSILLAPSGFQLLKQAAKVAVALERELFGCVSAEDKSRFQALVKHVEASTKASA